MDQQHDGFGNVCVSLNEQIREVERELRHRSYSYPAMIQREKLSAANAARRLAVMRAVLETLQELKERERRARARSE
jgi:hypothetical protein